MSKYSKVEYWDDRYKRTAQQSPVDWYQSYRSLRHLLNPLQFAIQGTLGKPANVRPHTAATSFPSREKCRVLVLGCGNSPLSEQMYSDGWLDITNVDFSSVVIEQMKKKNPYMLYKVADITKRLPFEDQSFDLLVCKGVFDAILTGCTPSIYRVVAECVRVLAPYHGIFFVVTNGAPDNRSLFFEHNHDLGYYWQGMSVHSLPHNGSSRSKRDDYLYICRKRSDTPSQKSDMKENLGVNSSLRNN